jgi:hypothetical protein
MTRRQVTWIENRKDSRMGYLERNRKGPEKRLPEVKTRKDRRSVYLEPKQKRTEENATGTRNRKRQEDR